MRLTHSDRLERWIGTDKVEHLSKSMAGWYGPPIAVHGVPGQVYICADGDFIGEIRAGYEATCVDRAMDVAKRLRRGARIATSPKRAILHAGFSSLSDLIAEASAGKRLDFPFNKVGPTGVANVTSSLWRVGNSPPAGAAGSAAPGGRATVDTTTGAFPFTNPSGGDTAHFVSGFPMASLANTLLLYDRIFDVAKTVNSSVAESVTGVPTRYQSSTASAADYAGGNFLFPEVGGTALAATAHNHDAIIYRNQAGTDTQTAPSATGVASAIVDRLDITTGWFIPLLAGDSGAMDLNSMKLSSAVATGVLNWVIGHPIAWMPCPIANVVCVVDGINTAFNLTRIFDDACLALLEVNKPATTATTYHGSFTAIYG